MKRRASSSRVCEGRFTSASVRLSLSELGVTRGTDGIRVCTFLTAVREPAVGREHHGADEQGRMSFDVSSGAFRHDHLGLRNQN